VGGITPASLIAPSLFPIVGHDQLSWQKSFRHRSRVFGIGGRMSKSIECATLLEPARRICRDGVTDADAKVRSMASVPQTRASLLVRVRDLGDAAAWEEFVEIYGPVVYDYGRRHGLQDADAADLTQEVLRAAAGAFNEFRYDPKRGSFRSWLFTVARTKRVNLVARQARSPLPSGDTDTNRRLAEVPEPGGAHEEESEWNREFQQQLLDWAAARVRDEVDDTTWQAFERTAVRGASPQTVANELKLSVGAVYAAKSRVLKRLRGWVDHARCDHLAT
jgi:RNA polymerase sigma factor (sigma-70 family)